MNLSLMSLEIVVVALGLIVLMLDLGLPPERRRSLGHTAALALFFFWAYSFNFTAVEPQFAFGLSYVQDEMALFFKRLFLLAGALALIISTDFGRRIESGHAEGCALMLFSIAGMMLAASASHFVLLFVAVELTTLPFFVLVSSQRQFRPSLEAGAKYLVLGALASAFLVFGMALVYAATGTLEFTALAAKVAVAKGPVTSPLFQAGMLLVLAGLGFKIASVPFQFWVPDVYQGAPTPVAALLAAGSKTAGFVLLIRVWLGVALPLSLEWNKLFMVLAGLTILYGNLGAIPQRNLKRLLGYSSIAHAGYLLLGVAVLNRAGVSALLFYLLGYIFAVAAAFAVIELVVRESGAEDISALSGLHQRSPLLATAMTVAVVSLAGIPPLAGFMGKFLLIKAVIVKGSAVSGMYWLAAIAIAGVIIGLWYYFGIIRAIFWSKDSPDLSPVEVSLPTRFALMACILALFYLGLLPALPLGWSEQAALALPIN